MISHSSDPIVTTDFPMADGSRNRERLYMHWTTEKQSLLFGGVAFNNDGMPSTQPSHDLAHLMVAANGNLAWLPEGAWEDVCLAEYNAVFVEWLLHKTFCATSLRTIDENAILPETIKHLRWFVEDHFLPFPLLAEEAYRQACSKLDWARIVDLSPLFFDLHFREQYGDPAEVEVVEMEFFADDRPQATEQGTEFSVTLRRILERIAP